MIVVKLGGSLLESDVLPYCLKGLEQRYQGRAVVIVPGGGPFADQVRNAQKRWQFDDKAAHRMAILAMQQMAFLFKALNNDLEIVHATASIKAQLEQNKTLIWSPDVDELDNAGVPATWDITSDSLAVWLAITLSAEELHIIKSVKIDTSWSPKELVERGIVDRAFFDFVSGASFKLQFLHKASFYP